MKIVFRKKQPTFRFRSLLLLIAGFAGTLLAMSFTYSKPMSPLAPIVPVPLEYVDIEWFDPETEEPYIPPRMTKFEIHHLVDRNLDQAQTDCLADAIYWEARGEPLSGQLAVGFVVLNRAAHPAFKPKTLCGVVYQSRLRSNGSRHCQFSWVCEHGGLGRKHPERYQAAQTLAVEILKGLHDNPIGESTFFHSGDLHHKFIAYEPTQTIGNHYFYQIASRS